MKTQRDTYTIVVRPEPDEDGGPNAMQRLRSLLKAMKRSYRITCVSIAPDVRSELPASDAGLDPTRDEPPFA